MASDFRKTIEERAKEVGMLSQVRSDYPYDKRSVEFGYTQGATDQKAIDIDKAWSLAYSMYQVGKDHLIPMTKDEFIKAMQECMNMYIARDEETAYCRLFSSKPKKIYSAFYEKSIWTNGKPNDGVQLDMGDFPEVTFENSPMEVELVIKKKEQA